MIMVIAIATTIIRTATIRTATATNLARTHLDQQTGPLGLPNLSAGACKLRRRVTHRDRIGVKSPTARKPHSFSPPDPAWTSMGPAASRTRSTGRREEPAPAQLHDPNPAVRLPAMSLARTVA